jgi:hypothetical protein
VSDKWWINQNHFPLLNLPSKHWKSGRTSFVSQKGETR